MGLPSSTPGMPSCALLLRVLPSSPFELMDIASQEDSSGRPQSPRAFRWYVPSWLDVPGLPTFEVIDTRSAQGRLEHRPKTITVADLVLFHGHACDGPLRGVRGALVDTSRLTGFALGCEIR